MASGCGIDGSLRMDDQCVAHGRKRRAWTRGAQRFANVQGSASAMTDGVLSWRALVSPPEVERGASRSLLSSEIIGIILPTTTDD